MKGVRGVSELVIAAQLWWTPPPRLCLSETNLDHITEAELGTGMLRGKTQSKDNYCCQMGETFLNSHTCRLKYTN